MGLLTQYPREDKPEFNKERIIQEIKDGLQDFPEWVWLTTPEYNFDLMLMRTKIVREEIVNTRNPMSEHKRVVTKSYQIVLGVFVTQEQGQDQAQEYALGQLKIASARQLFNKLKEYHEN